MEVKLGERYMFKHVSPWNADSHLHDIVHDNRPCRVLRPTMPKDFDPPAKPEYLNTAFWWVVFDDGYITVASSESELHPLPSEVTP